MAGVVTGVIVLGVGGRLVMLGSRLLHSEAVGRITENGNRIGEFTVDGTVELIVFGGLGAGISAAVVWVLVREWIPLRPVVVGFGAVAIGGFNLIDAGSSDFDIIEDPLPDLVLLLGLLFVFGASLVRIDRWLDQRLPNASGVKSIVIYSVMVAVGAPFLIPVVGSFFTEEFCLCDNPPIWTGVFLLVAAATTVWCWVQQLRGSESMTTTVETIASASVLLMATAGTIHLLGEIIDIL